MVHGFFLIDSLKVGAIPPAAAVAGGEVAVYRARRRVLLGSLEGIVS